MAPAGGPWGTGPRGWHGRIPPAWWVGCTSARVHVWRMCGVCVAHVWRMCGVCVAYVWRMCGVCVAYVWRMCVCIKVRAPAILLRLCKWGDEQHRYPPRAPSHPPTHPPACTAPVKPAAAHPTSPCLLNAPSPHPDDSPPRP